MVMLNRRPSFQLDCSADFINYSVMEFSQMCWYLRLISVYLEQVMFVYTGMQSRHDEHFKVL